LHLLEVHLGDVTHLDTIPTRLVAEVDELANLFDGETEIAAATNEAQTPDGGAIVCRWLPSVRGAAGSSPTSS
jgi:hypothetical protein